MIKNFTKLLVANWTLCLIVSFISSANAADDTVVDRERRLVLLCESKNENENENADDAVNAVIDFSAGNAKIFNEEHRPRLLPLAKLNNADCVAWHNGLSEAGYKSDPTVVRISEEFSANYGISYWIMKKITDGIINGYDTKEQAALSCWMACDRTLEGSIISNVKSYVEREGFSLEDPQMLETIKYTLNPSRGTVKPSGEFHKSYILTLDKTRVFKFHLTTRFSHNILNECASYRYTAKVTANLDIGIYEFLGN
jgi:hypothetical protein